MDKIFSPIKTRVLQYLDYKGILKENFYQVSLISASNFKGNGAKSELGGDKIVKILSIYPEIDANWLLLGKGEMLRKNTNEINYSHGFSKDFCPQCELRERLLAAKDETISALRALLKECEHE